MKKYIYIGQYFDILDREIGILDKKIGITNNLEDRQKGLTNTKSPIQYTILKAWSNDKVDIKEIETALHSILDPIRSYGEWFKDPDNDLMDKVSNLLNLFPSMTPVELTKIKSEIINEKVIKSNDYAKELIDEVRKKYPEFTNNASNYANRSNNKGYNYTTYSIIHSSINYRYGRLWATAASREKFLVDENLRDFLKDEGYNILKTTSNEYFIESEEDLETVYALNVELNNKLLNYCKERKL